MPSGIGYGLGRALQTLGQGAFGWADAMNEEQQLRARQQAVEDQRRERLSIEGWRPASDKRVGAESGAGMMVTGDRTPRPETAAPAGMPDAASLDRLKNALLTSTYGAKEAPRERATLSDGLSIERPAPTAARDALARRTSVASYDAMGGAEPFNPAINYPAVQQSRMATEARRPGDQEQRAAYDAIPAAAFPNGQKPAFTPNMNWVGIAESYTKGEMGQQNRTEFRVTFPPSGPSGVMSPAQVRAQNVSSAEGRAKTLGLEAVSIAESGRPNFDPVGAVRNSLRQEFGDTLTEGQIQGLAVDAVRQSEGVSRTEARFGERPAARRGSARERARARLGQ